LQQQYDSDNEEVLAHLPLAWRHAAELNERGVHRAFVVDADVSVIDEENGAEAKERETVTGPGPAEGARRRGVSDEGLVWPVLSPRDIGARPPCDRGQCRIQNEIGGFLGVAVIQAIGLGPALDEIVMR
jgi:hypothetical protein